MLVVIVIRCNLNLMVPSVQVINLMHLLHGDVILVCVTSVVLSISVCIKLGPSWRANPSHIYFYLKKGEDIFGLELVVGNASVFSCPFQLR